MKFLPWALAVGYLSHAIPGLATTTRNHEENDYYVLELAQGTSPEAVASYLGIQLEGRLGELPQHFVFHKGREVGEDVVKGKLDRRRRRVTRKQDSPWVLDPHDDDDDALLDGVLYSEKQLVGERVVARSPIPLRDEDVLISAESRSEEDDNENASQAVDYEKQLQEIANQGWQAATKEIRKEVRIEDLRALEKQCGLEEGQLLELEPAELEDLFGLERGELEAGYNSTARGINWDLVASLLGCPKMRFDPFRCPKPPLRRERIVDKLNITDPAFVKQWNLWSDHDRKHSIMVGQDWLRGRRGQGVTIAIVDDGVEARNVEFQDRFRMDSSWNFVEGVNDPSPPKVAADAKEKWAHGTRSAGVAAAGINGVCGVGVAPEVSIAGIRILGVPKRTAAEEAEALAYKPQDNDIYSCAWGPRDDGKTMAAPGVIVQRAMHHAIMEGRRGLGSVYVFASGNGGRKDDNCNYDGYTNSIFTMTVASVKRNGRHPSYGEECAANLVSTYGSGDGHFISTVDVGGACYPNFGGTSASAPMAAGVIAIALGVRPDLTWRDLQHVAVESATNDGLWHSGRQGEKCAKRKFSHKFGFGQIKTEAFVQTALHWKKVNPQSWFYAPVLRPYTDIPRGQEIEQKMTVTAEQLHDANFHDRLEHVTLTVSVEARRRGDIVIDLVSPSGTVSHLATGRRDDDSAEGFRDWTFMSVANWGERASGTWQVRVRDKADKDDKPNSLWVSWSLQLYGSVWDAGHVRPLPQPGMHSRENMNHTAMVREEWAAALVRQDMAEKLL